MRWPGGPDRQSTLDKKPRKHSRTDSEPGNLRLAKAIAGFYLDAMSHEHTHDHGVWTHDHRFLGHGHQHAERRARAAMLFTGAFMLVEIVAGVWFGSMALLADGVHMATHVGALGLAAGAYWLARRNAPTRALLSAPANLAISPPSPAPSRWG